MAPSGAGPSNTTSAVPEGAVERLRPYQEDLRTFVQQGGGVPVTCSECWNFGFHRTVRQRKVSDVRDCAAVQTGAEGCSNVTTRVARGQHHNGGLVLADQALEYRDGGHCQVLCEYRVLAAIDLGRSVLSQEVDGAFGCWAE